jgi:hypothetical protein
LGGAAAHEFAKGHRARVVGEVVVHDHALAPVSLVGRAGRALDLELGGFAVPEEGVGGGPAGALAVSTAVGEVETMAADDDVVVEDAGGPALDGAAGAEGGGGAAVKKDVGAGGGETGREVAEAVLAGAALDKRELAGDGENANRSARG